MAGEGDGRWQKRVEVIWATEKQMATEVGKGQAKGDSECKGEAWDGQENGKGAGNPSNDACKLHVAIICTDRHEFSLISTSW